MKQMMTAALLAAVMLLSAPAGLGAGLTIPGGGGLGGGGGGL